MTISLLGVGSGLQLDTMVTQLVSLRETPTLQRLAKEQNELESTLSGVGQLSSALSSFQDALEELDDLSKFQQRAVSLTQPDDIKDYISITTDDSASTGSFEIEVTNLAEGTRLASGAWTSATAGLADNGDGQLKVTANETLTFTAGSNSFTVDIAIDDTLETIRQKINDADNNFGVSATLIDVNGDGSEWRLSYSTVLVGTDNKLSVSSDNGSSIFSGDETTAAGTNMSINNTGGQAAEDATITVDGISLTNSSSNTFTNIQGLTIEALAETSGTPAQVDVSLDKDATKEAINAFVDAYNNLRGTINSLQGTATAPGIMMGDSLLRGLAGSLSTTISDTVSSASSESLATLGSLGISLSEDGTLEIDSTMLDEALDSNFDDVGSLFASSEGIAVKLSDLVDSYLEFGGIIDSREDSLNAMIDDVKDQRDDFTDYIAEYEQDLRDRFTALDVLMAQMNAQQSYIMSQLAAFSTPNSSAK